MLFFLALDLGVFHKHAHVVKVREALMWTTLWFALAMGFAFGLDRGFAGGKMPCCSSRGTFLS